MNLQSKSINLRNLTRPIALGSAKIDIHGTHVHVSGAHGKIQVPCPAFLKVSLENNQILIGSIEASDISETKLKIKNIKALAGTFRANLILAIQGVNELHTKTVIFTGTGSSIKEATVNRDGASMNILQMRIGKSHLVEKVIPQGLTCKVTSSDIRETRLLVSGIDLASVGQFASELGIKNAYKGGIHAWTEGKEIPIKQGKSG